MEFYNESNNNETPNTGFLKLEYGNDGNQYYVLEATTELYRGDDRDIDIENYYPRFFTHEEKYANVYGKIIYKFTVKKDLKLLAVDRDIKSFYNDEADVDIKRILRDNYGYESKQRLSESKKDNELLDYICKNTKYDGYAADKMNTFMSRFDPEITICKPQENLSKATRVNTGMLEKDIKAANAEARLINQNNLDRTSRQKKRLTLQPKHNVGKFSLGDDDENDENDLNNNSNPRPTNLFGDDDDENNPNNVNPRRKLFGGKRKSKRKSVKKKRVIKNRKNKRTIKKNKKIKNSKKIVRNRK